MQDRAIKAADVTRCQPWAHTVTLRPGTIAIGPEAFARERLAHHSQLGASIDRQTNQRPPDGQTANERTGTVDRIEHPLKAPAPGQP